MKRFLSLCLLFLSSCSFFGGRTPVPNPDPNHTHADFAVWVEGKKLDFSDAKYMSGISTDEESHDEADEYHHKYLHLHDGVGHVIHRHKPDLTLGEFLNSLEGIKYGGQSFEYRIPGSLKGELEALGVRLFVNGTEHPEGSAYVFQDGDKILITNATDNEDIQMQIRLMTDDACLYSKTCPWRGEPAAENCIADPEVPCVIGE